MGEDTYYEYELKDWSEEMIDHHFDKDFGDGELDYVVYVLLDGGKSGHYQFGPISFDKEPFYIGCGNRRN